MPTNLYFDLISNEPEQRLQEELIIESIALYGQDMQYMPRNTINRDTIFGEDKDAIFDSSHVIEMYIDNIRDFGGNHHMMSQFGMVLPQTSTFVVSRRRFQETITDKAKPSEGDLIYFPMANKIFEINYVDELTPFYQLGNNHTFTLTVELFTKGGGETFATNDTNIDKLNTIDNIDEADNREIQAEADKFLDKSVNTSMPSTGNDNRYGVDDLFGGL